MIKKKDFWLKMYLIIFIVLFLSHSLILIITGWMHPEKIKQVAIISDAIIMPILLITSVLIDYKNRPSAKKIDKELTP